MKKKWMGLLLSGMLVVSTIAGCKKTEAPADNATTTEETKESEAPGSDEESETPAGNTETEAPEDTVDKEDEGGSGSVMEETAADVSRIAIEAVANQEGKEVRIAALCCPYGPFWKEVVNGIKSAQTYLADYNCTVDIISLDSLDGQKWYDAIQNCIVKDYDVISSMGVSDSICSIVDEATAAGIKVYFYNSDTAMDCSRVAFIGQDLYAAGRYAADLMAEQLDNQGTVGIITGLFSVNAHELRRTGIEDQLKEKYPDIKVIPAVECKDNDSTAYDVAKDLVTGNPDISGILCTANGQIGTAQALEDMGLAGKIKIICFDYMGQVLDFVEKGTIAATISQGPFDQGSDPIIYGYNEVIQGSPEVTGNVFTKMDVITIENVAEWK